MNSHILLDQTQFAFPAVAVIKEQSSKKNEREEEKDKGDLPKL